MIDNDVIEEISLLTENFVTGEKPLRYLNISKNLNILDYSMIKLV